MYRDVSQNLLSFFLKAAQIRKEAFWEALGILDSFETDRQDPDLPISHSHMCHCPSSQVFVEIFHSRS